MTYKGLELSGVLEDNHGPFVFLSFERRLQYQQDLAWLIEMDTLASEVTLSKILLAFLSIRAYSRGLFFLFNVDHFLKELDVLGSRQGITNLSPFLKQYW